MKNIAQHIKNIMDNDTALPFVVFGLPEDCDEEWKEKICSIIHNDRIQTIMLSMGPMPNIHSMMRFIVEPVRAAMLNKNSIYIPPIIT